ncbi:MAG: transglutaminase domain-containing protein [Planctomycetota bacterium]|nr:transglutaminase domain-containing protein [Planctomycetota bacterium]
MPRAWIRAAALLPLVCLGVFSWTGAIAPAADEPPRRSAKWYDELLDGRKSGFRRVVWAPSTWQGKQTLRDTTTVVSRTQRNMAGMVDTFEVTTISEVERGDDGTLWWMRTRVEEPGRVTVEELTWRTVDGKTGYESTVTILGQEENRQRIWIPLEEPVAVDVEAFLSERIRAGQVKPGDTFDLRQIDVRGRVARIAKVSVVARETVSDENGEEIRCLKIVQRDPGSGREILLWLDDAGTFVQVRVGSFVIRRTTAAKAEALPTTPAGYTITVPASPPLDRIFNADRVLLDVHIRADEHRKLPSFPASPWSRVTSQTGDDEQGYVAKVELRRHDDTTKQATIPVVDKTFARHLEATAMMQTEHPLVRQTVRDVVGDERDARRAAHKLARFVFSTLTKRSPEVASADAVQILESCRGDCSEHCLLFVTLCRAAGIPARRCSGYVCIGGMWGSHAWCEIWTGQWIGADPTTGEVGTAARYLFFGYRDEPESYPSVVSSRARGRLRIETTRIEEGRAAFDLADASAHRISRPEQRRYLHVLAGIEARDVPAGWTVRLSRDNMMTIRGPGFTARLGAWGDQGADLETAARYFRGDRTTFAGVPALLRQSGSTRIYTLFSRRRRVQVYVGGGDDQVLGTLERVLAPTFAEPALAWPPDKPEAPAADPKKKAPISTDK